MNDSGRQRALLLTFDYELFLGRRSGSVERCMLRPTDAILRVLERHGCRAIFFVDCTYLLRLAEVAGQHARAAKDLERIEEQLRGAARSGHELFFHTHPHWLDARYRAETNDWDLGNAARFTLEALDADTLADLLARSKHRLDALRPVGGETLGAGFRAGGLFVEPFAHVERHLRAAGVRYDFSVLPGFVGEGVAARLDHRAAPAEGSYRFATSSLEARPEGEWTEFPLSRLTVPGAARVLNSLVHRVLARLPWSRHWGNGEAAGNTLAAPAPVRWLETQETLSVELLNPVKLYLYLSFLARHSYVHTISHPKLCSPMNVHYFDAFLARARRRFELTTDFRRMVPALAPSP